MISKQNKTHFHLQTSKQNTTVWIASLVIKQDFFFSNTLMNYSDIYVQVSKFEKNVCALQLHDELVVLYI